jgi:regulator of sirC expression with transglutaminase-like and TPR domain
MYRSLIRKRFREAVEREDAAIDLGYAALLIAQEEYRDLNPATYLARLDDLAARARR